MSSNEPYTLTQYERDMPRIHALRATCTACNGHTHQCVNGGINHDRLAGCAAYNHDGTIATPAKARQPWHAKAA